MADPVTGTHGEKIDTLVSQVAELRTAVAEVRTTLRLLGWLLGVSLPALFSLSAFLVYQTITTAAEVRAMNDRLRRIEDDNREARRDFSDLRERVMRLEGAKKP